MDIREELRRFDGKHVRSLETLAKRLRTRAGSVDELLALSQSDDPKVQTAATWILKRLYEQDSAFSIPQTRELLRLLDTVTHWEARLHLLQMLDGLAIPARNGARLNNMLNECLNDANKLVRAWSYNGLFVLAEQHPKFRPTVTELLREARQDAAASVRARVRQICTASSWADGGEHAK